MKGYKLLRGKCVGNLCHSLEGGQLVSQLVEGVSGYQLLADHGLAGCRDWLVSGEP